MKRQLRRRLERERRLITRRLERAVVPNVSGPVLGRAKISYELAERTKAVAHGGMGMIARLVAWASLADEIDSSLSLLKIHRPYFESDHVLNIAYNALCGGATLNNIEARRQDRVFLDGIGATSLPDPTTAGDFCRRFDPGTVGMALQEALNRAAPAGVGRPAADVLRPARHDRRRCLDRPDRRGDQGRHGHRLQRRRGYSSLVVSLANTKEPLYLRQSGANRPSHEGVVDLYDRAIALVREVGFREVLLRGDTDFALTANFDRWSDEGVRFVFGYDARANLVEHASSTDDDSTTKPPRARRAGHQDQAPDKAAEREGRRRAGPGLQGAAHRRRGRLRVHLPPRRLQS